MSVNATITPNGLQTEQGRIAGGEPTVIVADNVVFRRPGLIEPRGQLRSYINGSSATTPRNVGGEPRHVRRWTDPVFQRADLYYWAGTASDVFCSRAFDTGTITTGLTTTGRTQEPRSCDLGDRQAWTLDCGVAMVDNYLDDCDRAAGVPQGPAPTLIPDTTAADLWMPATGAVAYRTVIVRLAGNGIPMRGAPSPRVIYRQNGGAACALKLVFDTSFLNAGAQGDIIEVYRSQVTTAADADPGDEMRLRYAEPNTAGSFTSGWLDLLDDPEWTGATLYTSESQEGIALANTRPQYARDIATYNGMTFYAASSSRPVLRATLRTTGDVGDPAQTMCSIAFDGTTTALGTTITGVALADFDYLFVGQRITLLSNDTPNDPSGDATFPGETFITALDSGAGEVEINNPAITTGAVFIVAWDWFRLTTAQNVSTTMYSSICRNTTAGVIPTFDNNFGVFFAEASQAVAPYWSGGAGEIVRCWDNATLGAPLAVSGVADNCYLRMSGFDIVDQDPTQQACRGMALSWFVDVDRYDSATFPQSVTFGLTSTKPRAWDIAESSADMTTTTPIRSTQDGGPNYLSFSKVYIPEAVPTPYYNQIGGIDYYIKRIVGTNDSLWIFKGDGLWRMFGETPESLALQQVDPTCRMFGRDTQRLDRWIVKLGDAIYAWTSVGIVRITANGVERIDDPIRTLVRRYTPNNGETVTLPWAFASLHTGTVAFGFKAHQYLDRPLGFMFDVVAQTWSVLRTDDGSIDSDVLTVNFQAVTINGEEVTI